MQTLIHRLIKSATRCSWLSKINPVLRLALYCRMAAFCFALTLFFAVESSILSADKPALGRTFTFDFNGGPMKSRFSPQSDANDGKGKPSAAIKLQPKFSEGMEGLALESREATDGIILDLSSRDTPTLPLDQGSVRFWFKPDWDSGKGPGGYASLMSFGRWKAPPDMTGYWGLSFDPKGERIQFGAQSKDQGTTFIATSVQLKKDNWYEIVLSYDSSATWVYIDGKPHGPGQGISFVPPDTALKSTGLALGNTPQGHQPVKGLIDGFEIFNYPIESVEHQFKYFAVSAQVDAKPLRVHLQWPAVKKRTYEVKRRKFGTTSWKSLVTDLKAFELVDASSDLEAGQIYEYQVSPYRIPGRIHQIEVAAFVPPTHSKGKVLVLVDRSHWRNLQGELDRFRDDLNLDGWEVVMERAPRHVDSRWKPNVRNIAEVKELVQKHLGAPVNGLKTLILIGHVAVPYSGYHALDGHVSPGDDHRGAWSCDAYYGDLDGVWRDSVVDHINRTHPDATNVPGDGKFDDNLLPTHLEIAVGRVDFANLPSLNSGVLGGRSVRRSKMELELLKQYFNKNHEFRNGRIKFEDQVVIKSRLPSSMNTYFNGIAVGNSAQWFGHVPGAVRTGDGFQDPGRSLWAFMAGRSGSASFASGVRRTRDFNQLDKGPRSAYMMLYSSWHGDWNVQDAFLRACLAGPDSGLAAMSAVVGPWHLQTLGRGECLGYGYLRSANQQPRRATRALAILGDPTLGNFFTPPVSDLKITKENGVHRLNWTLPPINEPEGLYTYQFQERSNRYELMKRLAPSASDWALPKTVSKGSRIMVRTCRWIHSASGVFAHLSPGASLEIK